MADIGGFNKITNLWPARPSRPIEQFGPRKDSSQNQQRQNKKDNNEVVDDGPGKTIDEYA